MEFLELAADRYSVRSFSDRPIEPEKMEKILKNVVAERFNRAKARLSEVGQPITERQAKREKIGRFISSLENRDGPLTGFNEDGWYSLVDYVTVYGKDDIRFAFKNGMEVKA